MQDRVRVWLSAFVAELHQCEIHDKEHGIMELIDPSQYSQALVAEGGQGQRLTKQDAAFGVLRESGIFNSES